MTESKEQKKGNGSRNTEKSYRKKCGYVVNRIAKIYSNCKSITRSRIIAPILKLCNHLVPVATVIAIGFLLWANLQTRDQIKQQQISLDIQKMTLDSSLAKQQKSLDIQKMALDSSLALTREQISLAREEQSFNVKYLLALNSAKEAEMYRFIEDNKPIIKYRETTDAKIVGDSIERRYSWVNTGKRTASTVIFRLSVIDKNNLQRISGETISNAKLVVQEIQYTSHPFIFVDTFFEKITITWRWDFNEKSDSIMQFNMVTCDKAKGQCTFGKCPDNLIPHILKTNKY